MKQHVAFKQAKACPESLAGEPGHTSTAAGPRGNRNGLRNVTTPVLVSSVSECKAGCVWGGGEKKNTTPLKTSTPTNRGTNTNASKVHSSLLM